MILAIIEPVIFGKDLEYLYVLVMLYQKLRRIENLDSYRVESKDMGSAYV